jgi:hypothetical protein
VLEKMTINIGSIRFTLEHHVTFLEATNKRIRRKCSPHARYSTKYFDFGFIVRQEIPDVIYQLVDLATCQGCSDQASGDLPFLNPRSGWKRKAWGEAKRNPRFATAGVPKRAKRAIAQILRSLLRLSAATRALSVS